MEKKMKNGVLYVRVSASTQNSENQKQQLVELFKSKGIEIVKIFEEKQSGIDDDRPEFQKLLELNKEDVDYIGVWSLDRLSRKMSTILKTIEMFNEKKICILAIKDNFQSLDENFNVTESSLTMLEVYRKALSDRIKRGKANKKLGGK